MYFKKGTDILLLSFEQKIIKISSNDLLKNESRVKAYILKDCPWSKRANRLLNCLSIPHEVKLIDNDENFQKIMAQSSYSVSLKFFWIINFLEDMMNFQNKRNSIT